MNQEFGKGFTVANLKNMRQFYLTFPNSYALRSELTWTHYRLLMRVENENARTFYTQEAIRSQWSTRQLERQINSFFYERLLSSKNKGQVAKEIQTLEPPKQAEDVIRDPYVLEFLGLTPNDDFYETQIFASKYKLYLPSEEELLRELNHEYQALEAAKDETSVPDNGNE